MPHKTLFNGLRLSRWFPSSIHYGSWSILFFYSVSGLLGTACTAVDND